MIFKTVEELKRWLNSHSATNSIISTSGAFDPVHVGHVRCIQASSKLKGLCGELIVIVNGDGFLMRKKGFVFMPFEERLEIINAIAGVDYVVGWDDGSQFVSGALKILRPDIFAKGGDRSDPDKVPEFEVCQEIGCQIVFGVGGREKVQSSSDLTKPRL